MSDTMKVEFTLHAEERIAKRKLDREQVIMVALEPEQVVRQERKPLIAQSRVLINNKQALLRVAFSDQDDARLVITVYYTANVRRYWQGELDENQI